MTRLSIVLHTHMPYVEGFGTWPFGEEWLWEALATVYLPLLEVVDTQPLTLTLTPVLCDQLETLTGEAGDRFTRFLRDIRAPIHAQDAEGLERGDEPVLAAEVRRAAGDYASAGEAFERIGRDLVGAYASLRGVELWASAATHAVLPLVATDPGLRLQVGAGVAAHERRFPHWKGGFWLPECAYRPGLERDLAEHGVTAFCTYQPGARGPIRTEAGPVGVPVDWEVVELIWHLEHGYPVDPIYRDYHGRTVHDLKPWNIGGTPYEHGGALARAEEHARDFLDRVAAKDGPVCAALDTELLGHWWYEGLHWLRTVLAEAQERGVELVTVSETIAGAAPGHGQELSASSWGNPKDLTTWDSPAVAEMAWSARDAELRTVAAAAAAGAGGDALARAARELLAIQSSDWAFLMTTELAADYPLARLAGHREALGAALEALPDSGAPVEPGLRNLAPDLDLTPLCAP